MGSLRSVLVFSLVLLCLRSSFAENVTQILQGYPDLSKMTEVLSQPDVAKAMSIQPAVTILGLDNDIMDTLSAGKRAEEVTDIVKSHVILDYYDDMKLRNQPLNKAQEVVNLYQSSGSSQYGQGLTKLKRTPEGVFFYSTSRNSSRNDAKFVEKIYSRQFNVSIIKIDHQIYINGLNDDMAPVLPPLPPPVKKNSPAEAPEELVAESPEEASPAPAPAPADAPAGAHKKASDDDSADQTSSAAKSVFGLAAVCASAFVVALAF
ncbi:cell adhesion molecule [Lithospermum erythrorhizon]|uniref:Cell adhesion molecule n=1 Tax=Lithospermum erythrorhizon TaxID=34254 RepID=A0AAV3RWJ1_LITER